MTKSLRKGSLLGSNLPVTSVLTLLRLQGDEERKHRSGSEHGGQEAESLIAFLSGPRPDRRRRSGASQFECRTVERHLL